MKKVRQVVAGGLLVLAAPLVFASNIALYAQPNAKSDVVTKASTTNHFVEIFQGKDGWVKVGDRTNGSVGWVNMNQVSKDLKQARLETQIENQIQHIDQAEKNLQAEHEQFMQAFESRVKELHENRDSLSKELAQVKAGKLPEASTQDVSFMEKSISYTGGKEAKVTVTTVKNGKEETKHYEMPVTDIHTQI